MLILIALRKPVCFIDCCHRIRDVLSDLQRSEPNSLHPLSNHIPLWFLTHVHELIIKPQSKPFEPLWNKWIYPATPRTCRFRVIEAGVRCFWARTSVPCIFHCMTRSCFSPFHQRGSPSASNVTALKQTSLKPSNFSSAGSGMSYFSGMILLWQQSMNVRGSLGLVVCPAQPQAGSQAKPGQARPKWRLLGGFGPACGSHKPKPGRQAAVRATT